MKFLINFRQMNLFENIFKLNGMKSTCRHSSHLVKEIHEPLYLDFFKPQIPFYPLKSTCRRSSHLVKEIHEPLYLDFFKPRIPFYPLKSTCRHSSHLVKGIHEPLYLDFFKPQIPFYPLINVQLRSYDFAVLESHASFIHRLSHRMGVNVVKVWCSPHAASKYENLKRDSNAVEFNHFLNLYERNLQIENISAKMAQIYIEVVQSSLPPGVYLSVHHHDDVLHEEPRFIPDLQLAAFKKEYDEVKNEQIIDVPTKK